MKPNLKDKKEGIGAVEAKTSTADNSLNLTSEDLRALNIVFGYAKLHTIDNDDNLLELLTCKKNIFRKLKNLVK